MSYSTQEATYVRIGKLMHLQVRITTSGFTHTTASGDLRIAGIPTGYLPEGAFVGSGYFSGITADYTQFVVRTLANQAYMNIYGSGSAQAVSTVKAADMPTGGTVNLYFSASFEVNNG